MSNLPIILLAGNAGSGKDTVGARLVEHYGAVCVAQADPMKRFAAEIFGFTEDQLWGPSANRNAVDERTVSDKLAISARFSSYMMQYQGKELAWKVIPASADLLLAMRGLELWFDNLYRALENGIPVSPRLVLQTLGSEWGRNVSQDMWNPYAVDICFKLLAGGLRYSRTEGLVSDPAQRGYDFAVISDGRYRNEILLTRSRGGVAWNIKRLNQDAAKVGDHKSERELDTIPKHFYDAVIDNSGDLGWLYILVNALMTGTFRVTR